MDRPRREGPAARERPSAMLDDTSEASASEVEPEGSRSFSARQDAVEGWLRTEAAAAYDELRADPSQALTGEEVRRLLARNVPDDGVLDDLRSLPADLAAEPPAGPAPPRTEPS